MTSSERSAVVPAPGHVRVRFNGSHLDGAVLDLPERFADVHPRHLSITSGGVVFDRRRQQPVRGAVILEPPAPRDAPKPRRRRKATSKAA